MNRPLAFLNAGLSTAAEQLFNEAVMQGITRAGLRVYVPQHELPVGTQLLPEEIYRANLEAVRGADVIVSILDKPGLGVVLELGYAAALEKPLFFLRTDVQDYLGQVVEGMWNECPPDRRARSILEMERALELWVGTEG